MCAVGLGTSENQGWGRGNDMAHTLEMPAHTWCAHLLPPAVAGWTPTTVVALTQMEVTQWNLRPQTLRTATKSLAGPVLQMPGWCLNVAPSSAPPSALCRISDPLASGSGSGLLARYRRGGSLQTEPTPIAPFSMKTTSVLSAVELIANCFLLS